MEIPDTSGKIARWPKKGKDDIRHGRITKSRSGKEVVEKVVEKVKVGVSTIRVKEKAKALESSGTPRVRIGKTIGNHGDRWRMIGKRKDTIRVGRLRKEKERKEKEEEKGRIEKECRKSRKKIRPRNLKSQRKNRERLEKLSKMCLRVMC